MVPISHKKEKLCMDSHGCLCNTKTKAILNVIAFNTIYGSSNYIWLQKTPFIEPLISITYFVKSLCKLFLGQQIARILQYQHDLQTVAGDPQYHSL